MPSALPDPVLALSLASVQKLNNVDLDQLANLWNVFTKCKESLESGRRLENLSWRLWFREAHLLPPDTSLSDLADYTPLDTPLMSRRGSVTGNFSTSRPAIPTMPSLVSVDGRLVAAVNNTPLSDPEDGNWSDDDNDIKSISITSASIKPESRGRTPTRTEAGLPEVNPSVKEGPANVAAPPITAAAVKVATEEVSTSHGDSLNPLALPGGPLDRKRAVSSSSAFGSRARVKQHNTARRRRPLSFQQAIENLLDRSKDFHHNGDHLHSSSSRREGTADVGVDTNGRDWTPQGLVSGDQADVQQNSAPAQFSLLNAPSVEIVSPAPSPALPEINRLEEDRRTMPPPLAVFSKAKESIDSEAEKQRRKESRFFMAGQSVDDYASSMSGSLVPSLYSPKQIEREESPEQIPLQRAPSEAASDQSQHQRLVQQSHPHGHSKSASHGIATGARNRSAVGLSRAGAASTATKGRGPGRVASGGSTGSTRRSDGHSMEQHVESTRIKKVEKDGDKKDVAKQPVKFTLSGGDDDGDDEFTDDDSSGEEEEQQQQREKRSNRKEPELKSKTRQEDDEEEDEWSSASSTDSEELQRRVVARRKQEEVERQQSMFQKKPIKSASTADVQSIGRRSSAPMEGPNNREPPSPPIQPVRGLLSSLFHPEEGPHPPPGQLAGRPHASAADLRMKPTQQMDNRARAGQTDFRMTAMPSTTQVPSIGGGALKLSKSAVALPVLSTMGSRSEAKKGHEAKGSRDSAVFDDEESAEGSEAGGEYGTSEALARLNHLAHQKKERQREGKRQYKMRQSNNSLNVEVAPEMDEETLMSRRRTEAVATPVLASSRAGSEVPETSMPQTPRTTRRNMLRDELSESLRQSLLWERQSRNRMLGIGALDSNSRNNNQAAASDTRSRSMNRNQTVLGGGQLRPLTSSSSVTNISEQQQQQQQQRRQRRLQNNTEENSNNTAHRSYTGDFHHAGW